MSSEARRRRLTPATPALVVLLLAAVLATGCGKKGDPRPPLRQLPAPVKDLAIAQRGLQILLSFTYPKLTPSGMALAGVSSIEVWEVVRPAPAAPSAPVTAVATPPAAVTPPAGGMAPTGTEPMSTEPMGTEPAKAPVGTEPAAPAAAVPPPPAPAVPAGPAALDARELAAAGKLRLKLTGADVGAAVNGDRVTIPLPLPDPLPATAEVHYYVVRAFGPNGDRSEPSNQAFLIPQAPPAAPEKIAVTPQANGILVAWTPEEGAAATGFNVYRRASQARGYGVPIHQGGAEEKSYLDSSAQLGQSYIYSVTTLAQRTPLVESAIRAESEIDYKDRFPPPVPREPVALVEAGRVRIVWRSSTTPDLAGYLVYRRDASGPYARLTERPLSDLEYDDRNVVPGSYTYRVTAVDQLGNESAPAEVTAVVGPPAG